MKVLILIACAFALTNGFYVRPLTVNGYRTLLPKIKPLNPYQPTGDSSRIIGGAEAEPHSRPFQGGLFIDGDFFCGCSLIDVNWVLTAAHCTTGATSIEVVLGAHFINQVEATQQRILSSNIITNPDYGSLLLTHDVGLVQLSTPATINGNVAVISLPKEIDVDVIAGATVTVSGWGKTSDGIGGISDVLKVADVTVISNAACADVYGGTITNETICTAFTNGSGTCNGDSGGPLTIDYGNGPILIGVVSFVSATGCASGDPDGYTRTKYELAWIKATTGIA